MSCGPPCLFGLFLAAVVLARPVAAIELVSLGNGPSPIIEYDRDLQPIRKYTGLHKPVDITPIGADRLLIVDEAAHEVILTGRNGTVLWRDAFGGNPLRARPRPGGGFLITTPDRAIAVRDDRTIEWAVSVPGLRTAVPLPGGSILAASHDGQGWLTELTPDGRIVWRSRPWAVRDETGQWRYAAPGESYLAILGLDVAADGTIFTADVHAHRFRLLTGTHELLRDWIACFPFVTDTRFGPQGELVAVSPEGRGVWFGLPDRPGRTLSTDLAPWSAALTEDGTLLVGFEWCRENAMLEATAARSAPRREAPVWYRRTSTVALVALFLSVCLCAIGLGPDLHRRILERSPAAGLPSPGPAEEVEGQKPASPSQRQLPAFGPAAVRAGLLVLLIAGGLFAWSGTRLLGMSEVRGGLGRIALGCLFAGAALRVLDRLDESKMVFSSFRPTERSEVPARGVGAGRRYTMLALSIASLAGCLLLESRPESMAGAIGFWIAAQVLVVGASLAGTEPSRNGEREGWGHLITLAALLLASAVARFWEIGNFPDFVHHDHGIYGDFALRITQGTFQPLFDLSTSPLKVLAGAGAILLVGPEGWALRLTGAMAGVLSVLATYLAGRALFNRNVGLIGALLVSVNSVLLVHSRQPYLLEPVPLFVFCIFLFVQGMKTQSRFCFCMSGVMAAWTLLVYWAALTLAPAGVLIAALLCLFQPRWVLSRRVGLTWFLLGATVAFAPMVRSMLSRNDLGNRISDLVVLFNPDGSIRWDAALWQSQTLRSFGAFVLYPDLSAWGVSTGRVILSPVEIVFLGAGLVFLLSFRKTMAAAVLVPWIAVSVFLGSATLQDPPSYYHFLAAIVPVLLICAVPLERLLAWSAGWKRWWVRAAVSAVLLASLAAAGAWQLDAAWALLRRPEAKNGAKVYNADEKSLVTRFIRENPDYRYYLVRSPVDLTCINPIFLFFASETDLSDLTGSLGDALPIPSVRPALGAAFVVLSSRIGDIAILRERYPTGREVPLYFRDPRSPAMVFLVEAAAVELALSRREPAGPPSGQE
ncbi:MAG: glycosyltransferase family 39 protein [Holophagales bacterium]|nr:glycosyltransferase family 39 protein [Holophagales bacterium]